jgi:hypothetical protein
MVYFDIKDAFLMITPGNKTIVLLTCTVCGALVKRDGLQWPSAEMLKHVEWHKSLATGPQHYEASSQTG